MFDFPPNALGIVINGAIGLVAMVIGIIITTFILHVDKFAAKTLINMNYKAKSLEESAKENPRPDYDESSPSNTDHAIGNFYIYFVTFIVLLQTAVCVWYGGIKNINAILVSLLVIISFIKAISTKKKLWETACYTSLILMEFTLINMG